MTTLVGSKLAAFLATVSAWSPAWDLLTAGSSMLLAGRMPAALKPFAMVCHYLCANGKTIPGIKLVCSPVPEMHLPCPSNIHAASRKPPAIEDCVTA